MDSAYLHNSVFNIELKRRELEQQNLTRSEVKRWFEDNYRVFSKKSDIFLFMLQPTSKYEFNKS